MPKLCRECGREFEPKAPQALVCSDGCRRARARRAKRTYRRKGIGQVTEGRYRATPLAMERGRMRSKKHYNRRRKVDAWAAYWEHRLERLKARKEVAHA